MPKVPETKASQPTFATKESLIAALRTFPDAQHVTAVCRLGSGPTTCRYLTLCGGQSKCAKSSNLMSAIDDRASEMTARGDNCGGVLDLLVPNAHLLAGARVEYDETSPSFHAEGTLRNLLIVDGTLRLDIAWAAVADSEPQEYLLGYLQITIDEGGMMFSVAGAGSFAGTTSIHFK
jgi:hypothetical protein